MIVYAVFAIRYIEGYYDYEINDMVALFSSREKAQTYIDGILHQQKLDCKRQNLKFKFPQEWTKKNPQPERQAQDDEYVRYVARRSAAVIEYMATIDMNKQDLSDINLSYLGKNNFSIKELEVK